KSLSMRFRWWLRSRRCFPNGESADRFIFRIVNSKWERRERRFFRSLTILWFSESNPIPKNMRQEIWGCRSCRSYLVKFPRGAHDRCLWVWSCTSKTLNAGYSVLKIGEGRRNDCVVFSQGHEPPHSAGDDSIWRFCPGLFLRNRSSDY